MKSFKKFSLKIIVILLSITTLLSFISFVNADEEEIVPTSESEGVVTTSESVENSGDPIIQPRSVDGSDNVTSEPEEKKEANTTLFIMEGSVNIDYPVYGDAFIMGNNVTINNAINGTVFIIANNVTFTEVSEANTVFVLANNLSINGSIRDLYNCGNKLDIKENGYIFRDLYSTSKNFNLLGFVSRDAYVESPNINIPGEDLTIGGSLYYSSAKEANLSDSLVGGSIKFNKITIFSLEFLKDIIITLINTAIYTLVIILVIMLVFKKFSNNILESLEVDLGETIFYGILGLICIPIIGLILLITKIASLIGLILLALYALILSFSTAITAFALGKLVCKKISKDSKDISTKKLILISILIALAIKLLSEIPYVGPVIFIANLIIGSGIVLYSIKKALK